MMKEVLTKPIFALSCIASVILSITPCSADMKTDFVNPPIKFRSRPLWFWNNTALTATEIANQIKSNLTIDYDVIIEVDHIHLEYQPRG